MRKRKVLAAALAAMAIFGAPIYAPGGTSGQTAEAAFASRDVDQTPYTQNAEVDPYGQTYFRALPVILREKREPTSIPNKKMPWSGFAFFENPGEMEHIFYVLGRDAKEEEENALAGDSMPIYKRRYVQRMDWAVTSILESHAAYTGGHRGRFGVFGRNYDTRSGTELALDDVFTDTAALPGLIAGRLRADYPGVAFRDDLETWISEQAAEGNLSWTLFARGATFYFTPRAVVSTADFYDTGQMMYTATVFYGDAPGLFAEPYDKGSAAWSMEVEPFTPVRVPMGDGTTAMLTVKGLHIQLGDFEFTDEGGFRDLRAVFISLMDGRRYLYMDVAPGSSATPRELRVYRLSSSGVERLPGSYPFTMMASPLESEDDRLILPLTSPGNFCLCESGEPGKEPFPSYRWLTAGDLFSDPQRLMVEEKAHAHYHVGPDGWPEEGQMRDY
ncbi:MAG: hypothetical protein IJ812_00530 [Schwartzia sp.]|nr:hypothetical protein [Schwartzia sp. (in: firmicutes)]